VTGPGPLSPGPLVGLGIMAKYPVPGRAKTRLLAALTPEQAAGVQGVFLCHVWRRLRETFSLARLVTFCDPPDEVGRMAVLLGGAGGGAASVRPQVLGDLGHRLAAACDAFAEPDGRGRGAVLIVGTDSPDVPREHLLGAAALTGGADVVLGPTDDGGFWCLGMGPTVDAGRLLAGIDWSSGRERGQVLERASQLGYKLALAAGWDDVDHPPDLRRLVHRLARSGRDEDRQLLDALRPALPEGFPT